jgi:hypothetical protein
LHPDNSEEEIKKGKHENDKHLVPTRKYPGMGVRGRNEI